MDYLKDGRVASDRRTTNAFVLPERKSQELFLQKAARKEHRMKLNKFFNGLFDYCFPLSFRSDLREELDSCSQGSKTVSDYVYEIEEPHLIIGVSDKRQRVLDLLKGLNQEIRQTLRWEKLNPEVSSWRKIVEATERFELSKNEGTSKRRHSDNDHGHSSSNMQNTFSGSGGHVKLHVSEQEMSNMPDSGSNVTSSDEDNLIEYESEGSKSDFSHRENYRNPNRGYTRKINLSHDERKELMRTGRCFQCKERGHIVRDCPQNDESANSSEEIDDESVKSEEIDKGSEWSRC
jgi:hypothetical protein